MNIVRRGARIEPMRVILFGGSEVWKTSSLACAERALWADFHGSTATLTEQPDCLFHPRTGRPKLYADLQDDLRELATDQRCRKEWDWLMLDGLDDVERLYLVPEALRRAGTTTLGENYGKACDALVQLHGEFLLLVDEVWRAGYSVGMTCHEQRVERVNPDGANYMATEMNLFYQAGKVGKWNCPQIWRDWVDACVYLTTEGRKVAKGEKDKIGKARGDVDKHVAYLGCEAWLDSAKARRCESLESPLAISSPGDFWQRLTGTWKSSFDIAGLERRRAEVRALAEAAQVKNPEKLFAAVATARSAHDLEKIAASLQKKE